MTSTIRELTETEIDDVAGGGLLGSVLGLTSSLGLNLGSVVQVTPGQGVTVALPGVQAATAGVGGLLGNLLF